MPGPIRQIGENDLRETMLSARWASVPSCPATKNWREFRGCAGAASAGSSLADRVTEAPLPPRSRLFAMGRFCSLLAVAVLAWPTSGLARAPRVRLPRDHFGHPASSIE